MPASGFKQIAVDEKLHQQAKVEATRRGQSLKKFTEKALQAYLRTLVDSKPPYEAVPTP